MADIKKGRLKISFGKTNHEKTFMFGTGFSTTHIYYPKKPWDDYKRTQVFLGLNLFFVWFKVSFILREKAVLHEDEESEGIL